jgi:hypothetical protein
VEANAISSTVTDRVAKDTMDTLVSTMHKTLEEYLDYMDEVDPHGKNGPKHKFVDVVATHSGKLVDPDNLNDVDVNDPLVNEMLNARRNKS